MIAHLLLMISAFSAPDAYSTSWEQGNDAFAAGDYEAAIAAYTQLANARVDEPALYFNLGNAYARQGNVGAAVAQYERALQINPGMEEAQHNLAHLLSRTKRNLARPVGPGWKEALLFWDRGLSTGSVRIAAVILWCFFWSLCAWHVWSRPRYVRPAAGMVGVLAVLFALSAWAKTHSETMAVATAEAVPVRYGKSESDSVRFELYAGDRVLVDAREDGWARVSTVSGERGWAPESALAYVNPPETANGHKETAGPASPEPADTAATAPGA